MKLRRIVLTAAIMCCTIPAVALDINDKTFTTENAGKVVFSHAAHLKKKNARSPNISCKACHNDAMKKGVHYTMAQMEHGKSCGQCHNGKKAFALAKCTVCHKVRNITFIEKDAGNVTFSHKNHTSLYRCGECHTLIFNTDRSKTKVSMKEMEAGKSCGSCHDGKTAFSVATDKDCDKCHKM